MVPTPLGLQSSICLFLGHIQGVPVALGFGMHSILCVCVCGGPAQRTDIVCTAEENLEMSCVSATLCGFQGIYSGCVVKS